MADTRESLRDFKRRMAAVNARTERELPARIRPEDALRWASSVLQLAVASGWDPERPNPMREREVAAVRRKYRRLYAAKARA